MNFIDMHCDTLWKILDLDKKGNLLHNGCAVSVSKLKEADSMAQFFACFVCLADLPGETEEEKYDAGYRHVLEMADYLKIQVRENQKDLVLAEDFDDIEQNKTEGKISAILTVEEGGILNGKMERLEELYRQGIRLMTILWNYENCIGYPNNRDSAKMQQGLKPFGKEVVERMGELGMIIDVSHASDGTFWDVLRYQKGPVVASHSNCRALCDHPRNLSDEMIHSLAERGGIAGLNFYGYFLDGSSESRIDAMVAHMKHMITVGGSDFPAIGTDFDGFDGMKRMEIPDIGQMGYLAHALEKAGLTIGQIEKIWYGNVKRVLKK